MNILQHGLNRGLLTLCATLLLVLQSAVASALPPSVLQALQKAQVPAQALAVWVAPVTSSPRLNTAPRLAHRSEASVNPASLMKLVTTTAALDLLSPTFRWTTPIYMDGTLQNGILQGNVYIVGQGDPQLVVERLWLLMRRLQGLGINQIRGDIILDRSAFQIAPRNPADFDNEPLRPYNVAPDALLINYQTVNITFTPNPAEQTARVHYEPMLAQVALQNTVPLRAGACTDYRADLQAKLDRADAIRFDGAYPTSCQEKTWSIAYPAPDLFALRAIEGMWRSIGGILHGQVRFGTLPTALQSRVPDGSSQSPPLADVVRDINKFSNNVMAQQLFLTLGRWSEGRLQGAGRFETAREVVSAWWREKLGKDTVPVLENGSGLSRVERISALGLGRLLQHAYASHTMPELMASLPIAGLDGTLRRFRGSSQQRAHLKTGSLNDVVGYAGYVLADSGQRYVLVAILNHPHAHAARPALEALIDWTAQDTPLP
jgi:D-alanyl-D-alanine carboxypeptidase/D-alanyl-D-alanine-endopeptidase (penicillin-binding protein 4)